MLPAPVYLYFPDPNWNKIGAIYCPYSALLFLDFSTSNRLSIESLNSSKGIVTSLSLFLRRHEITIQAINCPFCFDSSREHSVKRKSLGSRCFSQLSSSQTHNAFLNYVAELGRACRACVQPDSHPVPFVDRRCLLTDLPKSFGLPNDTPLSMTQERRFFWPAWQCTCNHKPSCHRQALAERNAIASPLGKAMHMYPHGNCHPQTIGRKHRYCHTTCSERGEPMRRSNGTIKASLKSQIACGECPLAGRPQQK